MRCPNVSNLADELDKDRKHIRFHLYKLKAEDLVEDHWIRASTCFGLQSVCHEWRLTEKGEHLLREGGRIFQAL